MILCITETVSWGLLYYSLPTALLPIGRSTGWSPTVITGAFSAGMLVAAIAGIPTGRLLDRYGPGATMTAGSVLGALGLAVVGVAPGPAVFAIGWLIAGVAKALVLYQTAFAAITVWYGERRVRPLTILTLAGGFASTIFAPLVAEAIGRWGWRTAYLLMAAVVLIITTPLHAALLRLPWSGRATADRSGEPSQQQPDAEQEPDAVAVRAVTQSARFRILQAVMTASTLGMFAVTLNLVPLLTERGATYQSAALGLGLIGVGQVSGRLGFAFIPKSWGPVGRLVIITAGAAVGLMALALLSGPLWLLLGVGIVIGMARGCFTLVQATAVADRWGTRRFGTVNGVFSAPLLAASALAPTVGATLGGTIGFGTTAVLMAILVGVAAIAGSRT